MAKTLSQLRTDARELFGQTDAAKSNISDSRLTVFANDGLAEVYKKLKRAATTVVTTDYTTDSTGLVTLNATTISVRSARYLDGNSSEYYPLELRDFEWLRDNYPDFENDDTGRPEYLIRNTGHNDVRLYPIPSTTHEGSNKLRVDALEMPTALSADSDTPDIPEILHLAIPHYMAYRAHSYLGNTEASVRELTIFRSSVKSSANLVAKLGARRLRWTFGSRREGY